MSDVSEVLLALNWLEDRAVQHGRDTDKRETAERQKRETADAQKRGMAQQSGSSSSSRGGQHRLPPGRQSMEEKEKQA